MPEQKTWVGIDVGKEEFVVGLYPSKETWSVACKPSEIKKLIKRLMDLRPEVIVLEATGGYERTIAKPLMEAKLPVAIINARHVRHYAKSQGILAKTDKLDARVIAEFGAKKNDLRLASPANESEEALKGWIARRQQLVGMLTMERNRYQQASKFLQETISKHIKWLEEELRELDKRMTGIAQSSSELQAKEELLRSVPGVGSVLARTFIAWVPELGKIDRKEIAALIGVAPLNYESGKFKGQRKIWGGRACVRRVLYMGTLAAIQSKNNPFSQMYERLRASGKLAKVAIVAVMRKLLTVLNAMVRDQLTWKNLKLGRSST